MKLKKALSFILLFTFSIQSSILANGFQGITGELIQEALRSFGPLPESNDSVSPSSRIPDSIRMKQKIWLKSPGGSWQERDIKSLYNGERFHGNLFDLSAIKVRISDDKKSFYIEQWGAKEAQARHEFFLNPNDGDIEEIVYDREFLRLITSTGKQFSIYMPMAAAGIFNYAVPLVLNLETPPASNDQQQTHIFLVSRARETPKFSRFSEHFFTTTDNRERKNKDNNFDPEYIFEAGDQLLISEDGTLLGHFNVELLKTQYLYALEIVKIRAKHGLENNNDSELARIYSRLSSESATLDSVSTLLQKSLKDPVKRDLFLWKEWAPTFARIKQKAGEILEQLIKSQPKNGLESWGRSFLEPKEKRNFPEPIIGELEAGIKAGDLRNFWQYVLETPEKNENLINWVFEGNRKYIIAATAASATALVAFITATSSYRGWGPEWLRPFSDYLSAFIPDVVLMNPPDWSHSLDYAVYLAPASFFLLMMSVPLMQAIGATAAHFMGGKNKGVDFKLGLGTVSMRGYSYITPAWYLGLASFTKRYPNFFSPIAAGFSPTKTISPDSEIGKRLELRHEIQLGILNEPILVTKEAKKRAVSLRQRAIGELLMNKERGMSLAMLIGIAQLSTELKISTQEIFTKIKTDKKDGPALDAKLKEKFGHLAAGVQSLCEKDFYFKESAELSADDIALIEKTIEIEVAQLKAKNKFNKNLKVATKWLTDNAIRRGAAWGIRAKEILSNGRMSQPIAEQTWMQSRTDLVFGIFLTDFYGGRATYSNISQLAADPKKPGFLFASGPNVSDSFEQTAIYAIASAARSFMMWFIRSQLNEKTYEPIDMVELQINGKTPPALHEARAALRQLFSLDGAKLFANKMWLGSVTQRIEFIWASMLLGILPRIFLADSSVGDAFMGSLQSLLLSVGFNMFWWIVMILNLGVEDVAADNAANLRKILVDLKRSIEMKDPEEQARQVANLKSIYSIMPEDMKENFSIALKMIDRKNELSLEDTQLKAEQSKDELLEVWEEIEVLKKSGLTTEEIQKRYQDNSNDPIFSSLNQALSKLQQSIAATTLPKEVSGTPEQMLEAAKENPPVYNKSHWLVPELNVWIIGAFGSGVVGSYIIADSYSSVGLAKIAVILTLYFPILWATKKFLTKGLPHMLENLENQNLFRDTANLGKEEALRRAAKRQSEKLAERMRKSSLPNPLHACEDAVSALSTP